jgi:hypothetical protein
MDSSSALRRADALRALAARLGYALRQAKPLLSSSGTTRFLEPIQEVLGDIGDEITHLQVTFGSLTMAPAYVKQEISLFKALAESSPAELPRGEVYEIYSDRGAAGSESIGSVSAEEDRFVDCSMDRWLYDCPTTAEAEAQTFVTLGVHSAPMHVVTQSHDILGFGFIALAQERIAAHHSVMTKYQFTDPSPLHHVSQVVLQTAHYDDATLGDLNCLFLHDADLLTSTAAQVLGLLCKARNVHWSFSAISSAFLVWRQSVKCCAVADGFSKFGNSSLIYSSFRAWSFVWRRRGKGAGQLDINLGKGNFLGKQLCDTITQFSEYRCSCGASLAATVFNPCVAMSEPCSECLLPARTRVACVAGHASLCRSCAASFFQRV